MFAQVPACCRLMAYFFSCKKNEPQKPTSQKIPHSGMWRYKRLEFVTNRTHNFKLHNPNTTVTRGIAVRLLQFGFSARKFDGLCKK
jgi:hypothetical protein